MPDTAFDYQLALLVLILAVGMVTLLLPVPDPRRNGDRTHDITHTRRRR